MKVIVDHERCEGYARCIELAPTVFALSDDGQSDAVIERPGVDLLPNVERAVRLCPRQAISLSADDAPAPRAT